MKNATEGFLPVLKMTDLASFYGKTMQEMGIECTVHSTRLCERILIACPYLYASGGSGRDKYLTFRADVDDSLRESTREDDSCGFNFSAVAKVIRKDIFEQGLSDWEDGLENQDASTPLSLKVLLKMICRGPGCTSADSEDENFDQAIHTIAQLICFRTKKRASQRSWKSH